jgi:hypothetical protein
MKNVLKVLGVLALVGLLMSCFPPAPIVPASVAVSSTEGVNDTSFNVRYTAKGSTGQPYNVKKVGVTEEIVVNPTQTGVGVVSPRAISIISVVTCDPLPANVGEGCFLISITPRTTGTKTFAGSVSFKLDGIALSLPFTTPAP